jgi:hypothetical protein
VIYGLTHLALDYQMHLEEVTRLTIRLKHLVGDSTNSAHGYNSYFHRHREAYLKSAKVQPCQKEGGSRWD